VAVPNDQLSGTSVAAVAGADHLSAGAEDIVDGGFASGGLAM
jgi:hypothetical protein